VQRCAAEEIQRLPKVAKVAWHLPVDRNCRIAGEAGNRCKRASAFASAGISKSIRNTRPDALTLSGDDFRDVYSSAASDRDNSEAVCGGSRWKFSLIERVSCQLAAEAHEDVTK